MDDKYYILKVLDKIPDDKVITVKLLSEIIIKAGKLQETNEDRRDHAYDYDSNWD